MAAEHVPADEPLIAMPALTLDALRQAIAAVVPSRPRSSRPLTAR
jgi:hypothetical protein